MTFSIIVPLYNARDYFEDCVASVRAQSVTDWEMVIINDGSSDDSGALADAWAQKDPRIRVFHQENAGQFFARRRGIAEAKGDYLLFLDSDDWFEPQTLQTLSACIAQHTPDIVMFGGERVTATARTGKCVGCFSPDSGFVDKQALCEAFVSSYAFNSMCLKMFRRELFEGDTDDYGFLKGVGYGEDKVMNLYPLDRATVIYGLAEVLYNYRVNEHSVTKALCFEEIPAMLADHVFDAVFRYMKRWGMDEPRHHEAIAVHYLQNFGLFFYELKKRCRSFADKKALAGYKWRQALNTQAMRYLRSKRLDRKTRVKLWLAVRLPRLAAFL